MGGSHSPLSPLLLQKRSPANGAQTNFLLVEMQEPLSLSLLSDLVWEKRRRRGIKWEEDGREEVTEVNEAADSNKRCFKKREERCAMMQRERKEARGKIHWSLFPRIMKI